MAAITKPDRSDNYERINSMTEQKSDAGPERGDGEARGVSGGERVTLPYFATRPMIDSGPVKHRIAHAWHDRDGDLWALGSDGRLWCRFFDGWMEEPAPPGLEP